MGEKEEGSKTLVSSVSSPSINSETEGGTEQSQRNKENIKHGGKKRGGSQTGWQRAREQQDKKVYGFFGI